MRIPVWDEQEKQWRQEMPDGVNIYTKDYPRGAGEADLSSHQMRVIHHLRLMLVELNQFYSLMVPPGVSIHAEAKKLFGMDLMRLEMMEENLGNDVIEWKVYYKILCEYTNGWKNLITKTMEKINGE